MGHLPQGRLVASTPLLVFISSNKLMDTQSKRIVVKFKPIPRGSSATLDERCEQVLALLPGARLVRPMSGTGRAVFQLEPNADVDASIDKLTELDSIDYIEPDLIDRSA
jgi:hypothetical protein